MRSEEFVAFYQCSFAHKLAEHELETFGLGVLAAEAGLDLRQIELNNLLVAAETGDQVFPEAHFVVVVERVEVAVAKGREQCVHADIVRPKVRTLGPPLNVAGG